MSVVLPVVTSYGLIVSVLLPIPYLCPSMVISSSSPIGADDLFLDSPVPTPPASGTITVVPGITGPETSKTVTVTKSVAERPPAAAFRVKVKTVSDSTKGASKVTVDLVASPRDASGLSGEVWTHLYVTEFCGAPATLLESDIWLPSYAAWLASAWTVSRP